MTSFYSSSTKRTVPPKITRIPIPPQFRLDERLGDKYNFHEHLAQFKSLKEFAESSGFKGYPDCDRHIKLFCIDYLVVEGDDGTNTKLVMRHNRTRTGATEIVVSLVGQWDDFEKPSIEKQFDSNFFALTEYMPEHQKILESKKRELINYIYDYFTNDVAGKAIMEKVRARANIQQQRIDRSNTPHYEKIVRETAEYVIAKYHIATIWETKAMLYFSEGKYVTGGERKIEEEAHGLFQYDARTFMINEVKSAIMRQTYHDLEEFDADLNIDNVKNGLWHIKEKILTPHTPDYLSLEQKDVNYDPYAKCPRFEAFLNDIVYPQQVKTLKQALAYTFYRDTPHEVYVIMAGWGWNGKSKLMSVMIKIHGDDNVSYVPLGHIEKDPFALAGLERKSLNFDNEPSGGVVKNGAILKKLTGREPVRMQEKYVKAHNARLHAKLFNSTNDIPYIDDESIGRYRREIVIMFPYTFKPDPNPNNPMEKLEIGDIEEQLTTEEELSGIFNMMMDELHDILYKQKKRLQIDMQDIEARRKHRDMLKKPVEYFVEEVVDVLNSTPEDSIRKDDLHRIYERFCELNSLNPVGNQEFGVKLKRVIGGDRLIDGQREKDKDPVTKKRMTLWKGIKVKTEWLDKDKRDKQTSLLQSQDEDEDDNH